ncbi:TOX high mobility group box family member 4-like [Myxocyprinus asiaticus]|uniref:TOX high mobility group box family member 4-like n=1 Tax=Myxocyprinus asiaticus TaxID=70543 RepID=UPI0022229DAD|nr:TOX high mobility group box family member 4-like [Myxocyprinus asiaticus]
MDLNFYSDLSDGTGQHGDSEFMDSSSYSTHESVNKFAGGNDSYLTISGPGHHFLSSEQTFHTPSLGDEEFEIPPISLDPDSALTIEDVEAHFGEMAEQAGSSKSPGVGNSLASNVVMGGNDPSFASTFINPSSQGIEHLSLGVINQPGGSALLSSTLGVDLGHSVGSHFNSSSSITIDVPLNDMNHSLLGHNQLTTIDHSDLGAQLGLSLVGGSSVSESPEQPLSATPSPASSLQDEDMEDFRQKTMLVDSFSASPANISHIPNLTGSMQLSSTLPVVVKRVGGKPTMVAGSASDMGVTIGAKKGKKKKDPNEPQKPVSAYALFFRDTQAAIKGQNPNATFGEVSKIVASMWDSLGEEQKQVYKRKTEAAKKEYLKALAVYRANQLSKPSPEVEDTAPSTPPSAPCTAPAAPAHPARLIPNPDENTITNICASNIILDLPQVTTRSRTGSLPVAISQPPTPNPSPAPTFTKIIISKQMLEGGAQLHQIPTSMVTVIPAGIRAVQSSVGAAASTGRQPPPLLQMQGTPPPPRLQQMVQTQAPPPLQAKPRGGPGSSTAVTDTPPPPLQIKIVPASLHSDLSTPIIVTTAISANPVISPSTISAPVEVQVEQPSEQFVTGENEAVMEKLASEEMEVSVTPSVTSSALCVRAGCTNLAVESRDWDKEYCSNECVATHCRDIFMAWCSIKSQNSATVK